MITLEDLDIADVGINDLQGHLEVSYADLVEILGPPHSKGVDGKVDARWDYVYKHTVFSIYNYKNGPNYTGEGRVDDIIKWHIGGFSDDALDVVTGLFIRSGIVFKIHFQPEEEKE